MNKAKLKAYAPQARQDFIAAVTARANLLGLSDKAGQLEVAPAQTQGDITLIAGQAWPVKVQAQRDQLIQRMAREGLNHTCEAVAYTWFNRFAALRYMELHDYLGHGHRALSSAEGHLPDILTHAADLAQAANDGNNAGVGTYLPGLNAAKVLEMKLAGNRDGELYRLLLVAQCNALSAAMPFLFERIDDDTELLLPDNLLRTDSVIAKLVAAIPEEDWAEVEIIGWLYQFYISEKKDQVIGKVVKSEDIPAATQLFTPNWIVQYLVQNSVGRLWLMANPSSTLGQQWPYYIQPAEQTPEVQAQLDALIQTRMMEDSPLPSGEGLGVRALSLNPETITVLDPACGSGHILVVAYDVLKAIYLERGYQARAIPRLILEKNLYGLDIDDRAAQMAGFALLMKARADDRRLFNEPPKLNVLALQESKGLDAAALAQALASALPPELSESTTALAPWGSDPNSGQGARGSQQSLTDLGSDPHGAGQTHTATAFLESPIAALIDTFTHAKTFGSLIQIGLQPLSRLRELLSIVNQAIDTGDLYAQAAAQDLLPLVQQALVLGMQFDAVVANPPYMGGKGMNSALKEYAGIHFPESKADLFAMFMVKGFEWCKPLGLNSMVTMQSWMFLSSYQEMRERLLKEKTIFCLNHMGNGVMGIAFGTSATVLLNFHLSDHLSDFSYCDYENLNSEGVPNYFPIKNNRLRKTKPVVFQKIPANPIAYWLSDASINAFKLGSPLEKIAEPRQGMATSDVNRFIRYWFEVDLSKIGLGFSSLESAKKSKKKWFPHNKGGEFRRWYGNNYHVVNWEDGGKEVLGYAAELYGSPTRTIKNISYYFKPNVSWSLIGSGVFSARVNSKGFTFDVAGPAAFPKDTDRNVVAGFLNSNVAYYFIKVLNPTMNFNSGDIARLPYISADGLDGVVEKLVKISKDDWDAKEISFDFSVNLLAKYIKSKNIEDSWASLHHELSSQVSEVLQLERQNNSRFIQAYGLNGELTPEVPEDQITLARADREKDCQRLISYAIGCMMGRYSLDEPGLIYAHAGNVGFDPSRYKTFPADADGIVPITDQLWFTDDAASRIREFLLAVWGDGAGASPSPQPSPQRGEGVDANMAWLAESLGQKTGETPEETIRRYLADKFFKDHLQTYKKRPIYWLFSSGKQGAFQALVYLHRYTEGTLARLRAEYVVPLTGKLQARITMLQKDLAAASSTAGRNKLSKEIANLNKKHAELLAYDEILRHYADKRITLDLDDGVKVNYGKFGDLLEGVKAVTGGAGDD